MVDTGIGAPTPAVELDANLPSAPPSALQAAADRRTARRAALTELAAMIGEEVFY